MATHLHPLAHLTQLIHSEPSSFSDEPITYILHSSVDSTKKHWKVRLYTFVGPDDAEGDEDDGNDGREQGGIWLYKGYMTIKDVCRMIEDDLHGLTDPHNDHCSSSLHSPSNLALRTDNQSSFIPCHLIYLNHLLVQTIFRIRSAYSSFIPARLYTGGEIAYPC